MNRLSTEKRVRVVAALVEGNSIRATCRMTGAAKNTVAKLLRDLGMACANFQDRELRNLPCAKLQVDEIWSFVYAKAKNVPADKLSDPNVGDVWTWTAICADTKLVPSWLIGGRDAHAATVFMRDLASRLAHRVQLTSDGHSPYLKAVDDILGEDVDYAMLAKLYGADGNPNKPETKYSPGKVNGTRRNAIKGNTDRMHVSTFYVERQNLTMRMCMRRFTRLTNTFSKKVENLAHAVAIHFMHYNFCRKRQTLRMTPAQVAGVTDHRWSIEEMLSLLGSN
ncbi:MAG: DDE-type integrase/transposase/recombinase [bacterium]|nr:DDE-type integrase/transposase/recombinase [bacterium]